jgi:hypothetical protein
MPKSSRKQPPTYGSSRIDAVSPSETLLTGAFRLTYGQPAAAPGGRPGQCAGIKRRAGTDRTTARRRASTGPARRESLPMQFYTWSVYCGAARVRWIGQVVAVSTETAIEAAAVEFKADIKKLIAVRAHEIA